MRAGPGRKAKDLEMPITCTLFANSAADWNMQLAATRKGGRKRCAICSQIYQRRMQAEFIESGALRRVIAVYRAKHRLQPCEPKPRPAEARNTRSADFGTRTFAPPVDRVGQKAGADISQLCRTKTVNRLRLAQHCELQNRRTRKTGAKQPQTNNDFLYPPAPLRRQRTAESTNHADKSRNPCHSGCEVA